MIKLVFEINPTIGSGHFVRCRSLSEMLDWKYGIQAEVISESDLEVSGSEGDIYVLDLFDIAKTTKLIRETVNSNLTLTLDYFSNDAFPDFNVSVLEQFSGTRDCANYTGLEYCFIRPDFLKIPIIEEKGNEVFVYIGGDGNPAVIQQIVEKFEGSDRIFNIVRNQNSLELNKLPDNFRQYYLPPDIIEIMNRSEFGIVSPGLATMELLYLNVPPILCPLNNFHEYFTDFLIDNTLAISRLADFRPELLNDLESIKKSALKKVDGKGLERVIELMLNRYEEKMGCRYPVRP